MNWHLEHLNSFMPNFSVVGIGGGGVLSKFLLVHAQCRHKWIFFFCPVCHSAFYLSLCLSLSLSLSVCVTGFSRHIQVTPRINAVLLKDSRSQSVFSDHHRGRSLYCTTHGIQNRHSAPDTQDGTISAGPSVDAMVGSSLFAPSQPTFLCCQKTMTLILPVLGSLVAYTYA